MLANEQSKGMGEQEEGMDLADEVDMGGKVSCTFEIPSPFDRSVQSVWMADQTNPPGITQ